jgi:hypothetical protein
MGLATTGKDMEIRRGILKAFNSGTYLADVQIIGSLATYLTSVPTSRDIASGDMVAGRNVAILFFDPSNPTDAVITAVWV